MTHKDIYTKFMIEYDKANVTSSYPSLTEYEVATVLDKAYNALIAQKVTGNNFRRSTFESDVKAIADLEPLVKRQTISLSKDDVAMNSKVANLPDDMLYFVQAYMKQNIESDPLGPGYVKDPSAKQNRDLPVQLVPHELATKFFSTAYNLPWIKIPVCYLEGSKIHIVHDPINLPEDTCDIVYIKHFNPFVKDLENRSEGWSSFFDWSGSVVPDAYQFECNSTVAEELISLAVAFALENVESQRLNSKLNMRGLEA